ncbi:MAG: hypothetical protein BGN87_19630 [Rhizobiales bacterium 65-79]|jgi:hypothetical protein|nr:hypothetical protein [Hyphomicrobiales bacterium]OJU02033.1 MAG: hypothetical protein BGN87_19630 [Rhizobiales bacterium 65-79]
MDSTTAIPGSLIDIFSLLCAAVGEEILRLGWVLVQAEEGQDGHDHHDQADQVDDPVHIASPLLMLRFVKNASGTDTFPSARANAGNWTTEIMLHCKSARLWSRA